MRLAVHYVESIVYGRFEPRIDTQRSDRAAVFNTQRFQRCIRQLRPRVRDSPQEAPSSIRNRYNLDMVALSQEFEFSGKDAHRFFPHHHTYRSGAVRCSKASEQVSLRHRIYDECEQLESCSRDPIGYQDDSDLYISGFVLVGTGPSGTCVAEKKKRSATKSALRRSVGKPSNYHGKWKGPKSVRNSEAE